MPADDPGRSRLWAGNQTLPPGAPEWVSVERHHVRDTLLATWPVQYPCHFGSIGERGGTNHYTYLDLRHDRAGEIGAVGRVVGTFLAIQTSRPADRLTLLIMVGPPVPDRSLTWYRELFWDILSGLHAGDEQPRPAELPADPDDPAWNFHLGGESLFVFGTCPAYGRRRSRVLARCLVIGLQSRSIFHDLGGDTGAGRAAKRRIRASLAGYEDVPPIADSGDGLGSTSQKWKQYFPDVDGRPLPGRCPIRLPANRPGEP